MNAASGSQPARGVIVAPLIEFHPDRIVVGSCTLFLRDGKRCTYAVGTPLEVAYTEVDGRRDVDSITPGLTVLVRGSSRASPRAPLRTYLTSLGRPPPTIDDGATPMRGGVDRPPRPNPICAVCAKSILPQVPRYRHGLTSVRGRQEPESVEVGSAEDLNRARRGSLERAALDERGSDRERSESCTRSRG